MFLDNICNAMGGCVAVFGVFFCMSLGLNLDIIGKLAAVSGVAIAICLALIGNTLDKWHPVRVVAYLVPLSSVIVLNSCVWLFIRGSPPPQLYFWATVLFVLFSCLMSAATTATATPRQMELFPPERYGQFCGAQALLVAAVKMIGGVAVGLFIDFFKNLFPGDYYAYRFIYLWQVVFVAVALVFHYRVYRAWKRLDAEDGYAPPHQNFSMRELLSRPPTLSVEGHHHHAGVNRHVACLGVLTFLGLVYFDLIFLIYFGFFARQTWNASVFLVLTSVTVALIPLYLRLLRFMERP